MAITLFPVGLKESLKKNAQKSVEKVPITRPDINKVHKGHLNRQTLLFLKLVFVHDYDQNYQRTVSGEKTEKLKIAQM